MNDLSQPLSKVSPKPITDPLAYAGYTVKSTDIVGTRVLTLKLEDAGKVEEVAIDVKTGRIAYLVISFGAILGLGGKLYAVPWKAVQYHSELNAYLLNVTPEQIEHAPGFEPATWPAMSDPAWNQRIHEYYNVPPYWGM